MKSQVSHEQSPPTLLKHWRVNQKPSDKNVWQHIVLQLFNNEMAEIYLSSLFAVLLLVMVLVELEIMLNHVVYHIRITYASALHVTCATTFEFIFELAIAFTTTF